MEILNINLINIVIRNINKTWRLWLITILYFWYKIYNQIQATINKKLDKLNAQQEKEDEVYIKNIFKEEIDKLKFKKLFKFGSEILEFRIAVQKLFEDNNKPTYISYSKIRKFIAYTELIKKNDNYELDIKQDQFATYLFPTIIFSCIATVLVIPFMIVYQTYSHLYGEKLNIAQILPYYNLFINSKVYLIFKIIIFAIIVFYITFLIFRILNYFELNKLKESFDKYYKRTSEKSLISKIFEKLVIWVRSIHIRAIWIFLFIFLLNVVIFAYSFYTMHSSNAKYINKLYKNTNKLISNRKKSANILSDENENKLAVNFYLGINGYLKNSKKAIYLWNKAANRGYPYSELNLGYVYAKYANDKKHIKTKTEKYQYLSKARLLIEKAFYNQKANRSVRALAQRVWDQYKLWKYPIYKTSE